MATKNPSRSLVTPVFRLLYDPALVEPRENKDEAGKPTGKFSYQAVALIDEADLGKFKLFDEATNSYVDVDFAQSLVQLAKEAWPNIQHPTEARPMTIAELFGLQIGKDGKGGKGWPLKKGDALAAEREAKGKKGDATVGKRVLSLKSNVSPNTQPPALSMKTGEKTFKVLSRSSEVDMEKAKNIFKSGSYALATISVVANTVNGTRYLTPYVNGIRYIKEGPRIGGQSEMDRFDGYQGGSAAHDPTEGMDDEIPF